jgi:hypothetical protein
MSPPQLLCSDCGCALKPNRKRKGTRCRSCLARHIAADPAIRARAIAAIREKMSDRTMLARRNRTLRRVMKQKMRSDPAYAERQREAARRLGKSGASARANPAGSEARIRAGRSVSKTRRRGIPAQYWDEYHRLVHRDHVPAAEARQLVIALRDKDRRAKLQPEEVRERQKDMQAAEAARRGSRKLALAMTRATGVEARP